MTFYSLKGSADVEEWNSQAETQAGAECLNRAGDQC